MAIIEASGTVLKNGTNTITQVTSLTPPDITNNEVDTTDLDASNMTGEPTLPKFGTLKFTLNYDAADTQHLALYTASQAGTTTTMHVVLTDSGAVDIACPSWVSKWTEQALTPGQKAKVDVEMQLTDAPTIS